MTEKRFIEQFEENVQKYPDKVILRDEHSSLTFRELDELSGRVYAYLKEKEIGREDFVSIQLPRCKETFVVLLGIWKAGAAALVIEEGTPEGRINHILQECSCKLSVTPDLYTEILTSNTLIGYTETNKYDAAFIVYTSGSEGRAKGVLHEYGKLEIAAKSWMTNQQTFFEQTDRLLMPPGPQGSAGVFDFITMALSFAITIDVSSNVVYKSANSLSQYIKEHGITVAAVPPSYLSANATPFKELRYIVIGTENAIGAFVDDHKIINMYGQTEGAIVVSTFLIDKQYDITPIGKETDACHIYLKDEKNIDSQIGELCYENPYTRGYINLPEETARAFRNGLYHTGDIARINEDGNYVILGRKSDMIKINGNRIEPAEIEAAVKKVLGIDWAFAKGFVEPERSFIVVYYTANIDIDYASVREQLLKVLPTYMIPSYFVHLDEVPHLPNGKVDRQALRAPDIEQYRAEYVAPENELEERICTEMEQVLCLGGDKAKIDEAIGIGVNDDFYLLGGDSLRTIELVTNLNIEDLTVADIYAARMPRAIAERWMKKMMMN